MAACRTLRTLKSLRALRARTAVHRHRLPVGLRSDPGRRAEPASALWPERPADCLVAPLITLRAREGYTARHAGACSVRLNRLRGRRREKCDHAEHGSGTSEFGCAVAMRLPKTRVPTPAPLAHPIHDPRRVRTCITALAPRAACVTGIVTDCYYKVTLSYLTLSIRYPEPGQSMISKIFLAITL
jgi:hypothetical protein